MAGALNGELVPLGGGEVIPLLREVMTLGRRKACDIVQEFPNISGLHCEFSFRDGYWSIRDLNSTNGIKVNGIRLLQRPLKPGDEVTIGKRRYTIQYQISSEAQIELETLLTEDEDIFEKSLLERAGLETTAADKKRMSSSSRIRKVGSPQRLNPDFDR
jgi:pSer/pThr/pTyr-binding forkhead associated (FHA) protein